MLGLWVRGEGGEVWQDTVKSGKEIDGLGVEFTSLFVGMIEKNKNCKVEKRRIGIDGSGYFFEDGEFTDKELVMVDSSEELGQHFGKSLCLMTLRGEMKKIQRSWIDLLNNGAELSSPSNDRDISKPCSSSQSDVSLTEPCGEYKPFETLSSSPSCTRDLEIYPKLRQTGSRNLKRAMSQRIRTKKEL
ncbi:hypothetical protein Tco_0478288 [Tanacetum coccineum]